MVFPKGFLPNPFPFAFSRKSLNKYVLQPQGYIEVVLFVYLKNIFGWLIVLPTFISIFLLI